MTSSIYDTWRHQLHELVFRTLFRLASAGGDRTQRVVYRIYFGILYRREDPWSYATSPYEVTKYARTLELIRGRRAARALDAGCAEGHFTAMLLTEGLASEVVGVELNPEALSRARRRCEPLGRATFEAVNLAYDAPAGPFDLIVCGEVLYYLGDKARDGALILLSRLAPGGRLVAVHPIDRAATLHAPWHEHPSLTSLHHLEYDDPVRPYAIDVWERRG